MSAPRAGGAPPPGGSHQVEVGLSQAGQREQVLPARDDPILILCASSASSSSAPPPSEASSASRALLPARDSQVRPVRLLSALGTSRRPLLLKSIACRLPARERSSSCSRRCHCFPAHAGAPPSATLPILYVYCRSAALLCTEFYAPPSARSVLKGDRAVCEVRGRGERIRITTTAGLPASARSRPSALPGAGAH